MNYARIENGRVMEIILPVTRDIDITEVVPGEDGAESTIKIIEAAGTPIPIEARFHADLVATMFPAPDNVVEGYTYADGVFTLPAGPRPEDLLTNAVGIRDMYLSTAALRIAPLQDAADLGDATDAETAELKAWKQYRVAVNRVHQQAGWPAVVEWPLIPA